MKTIFLCFVWALLLSFQVGVVECAPAGNAQFKSYLPPPLCEMVTKEVEKEIEEDECKC